MFVRNLTSSNPQTFSDLLQKRLRAFINGDLVKEYFNKECKGTGAPFQSGDIFSYTSANKSIVTSHVR